MKSDQKRLITAVALSALVLIGWQTFFAPELPVKQIVKEERISTIPTTPITANINRPIDSITKNNSVAEIQVQDYKILGLTSSYNVNNNLVFTNAHGSLVKTDFINLSGVQQPFEINILDGKIPSKLHFNISYNEQSKTYYGEDTNRGVKLIFKVSDDEKLHFTLSSASPYLYQLKLFAKKKSEGNKIRQFILFNKDIERIDVGDDEIVDGSLKWAGIDFDYHLAVFVFNNKIASRQVANQAGELIINFIQPMGKLEGYFTFQQKNYDNLVSAGDNLQATVDFGIFAVIAIPILRGLQFFYKYIPNYGVSIIILTLMIRLLLLPLNYKSFKSMKKMQLIQPEINKLKEKYKEDPQRMQKETMALFKKAGANPLGGCLPLLLQMPVFFAFYRVLFSSVELVGAPFVGWIHDLSIKDPYYVLPVLMTITMFLQQKFMPSASTDPTQKKIMLIMPLVFGVIMKDLPAGLALYIFISTLVGIIQQYVINRSKT